MAYRFITSEEVESLPSDDGRRAFLAYEAICQERYYVFADKAGVTGSLSSLRASYIGRIAEAARQYGVEDWGSLSLENFRVYSHQDDLTTYDFDAFEIKLQQIITRLEIQVARENRESSLILTEQAKLKIEHHIKAIRERIDASQIAEGKKKLLNKKLDELSAALSVKRLNLSQAMVIIASAFVTVEKAEEALIKLPETMAAIQRLIGEGKVLESKFLPNQSPKQIEAPKGTSETFTSDLDDDIPF